MRQGDVERLRGVLRDLAFPAARWQLVTHAESYGADGRTRRELAALPAASYASLGDVLAAVARAGVNGPRVPFDQQAAGIRHPARPRRP